MSQVYATEPVTSGRVIFETTYGPLELSLWSKECPTATKLFLQLCMDGFYENMLFHRIVPNFLIQTGALRQPQSGDDRNAGNANAEESMEQYRKAVGAEEALERRKYEVHSRLRFNHRGQLAMALGVADEESTADLQPQLFITLDEAPYLDGKHVIFGTVSGPTIFNALRIGSSEVDESSNQPVDMEHAPRIKSVKIVDNPLHKDLVPQNIVPWRTAAKASTDKPKKKKKRKGKLDVNVLSFGDELEDGETNAVSVATRTVVKSSHDILDGSKTLSKNVDKETAERVRESSSDDPKEAPAVPKRKRPRVEVEEKHTERERDQDSDIDSASIIYSKTKVKTTTDEPSVAEASIPEPPKEKPAASKEEKLSSKASSIVELRRAKYMTKGKASKKQREEGTMAKLTAFQNKVKDQVGAAKRDSRKDGNASLASRMARRAAEAGEGANDQDIGGPAYHGQVLESDDEEQGAKSDWLGTRFKCRKHMDHHAQESGELGGDGRSMDDYLVLDPSQKEANDRGDRGSSDRRPHRDKKDGHRRHHKR
jgi:peptidyl-prolyl cis-trans isomerase SDCCAG10